MPGLEDILGKDKKQLNPLEATPQSQVANPDENPLEKMDKISKKKDDTKSQDSKELDAETIEQMLMTGDNTNGMFTPKNPEPKENEPKLNEEVDKDAKRKIDGKKVEPSEKYKKNFKNDLLKHPNDYTIDTPEGKMTVAEAMKRGYNPVTKTFEEEHNFDAIKERSLGQLNDADRENISKLIDPSAAQVAPADANKFGLAPDSPMVRQDQPPMAGLPGMTPPSPQGMGGQVGMPMPGAQESQAPGGLPLEALLGGAK